MASNTLLLQLIRALARTTSKISPNTAAFWLERLFTTPRHRSIPARERACLDRAHRSRLAFDAERSMPVYSWGRGPTVVLVHGWSGRGGQLAAFVEPLTRLGYRVVTFDGPAHGDADGKRSTLPELALAVEKVVAAQTSVDSVIAHSLGTTAVSVALSRGLDQIRRVVYLAPPDQLSGYLERLGALLGFTPDIAPQVQAHLEQRHGLAFEQARTSAEVAGARTPALIFHDVDDREVPHHEGVNLAKRWRRSRMISTRGLGHYRIVRAPEVVGQVSEFLQSAAEGDLWTTSEPEPITATA